MQQHIKENKYHETNSVVVLFIALTLLDIQNNSFIFIYRKHYVCMYGWQPEKGVTHEQCARVLEWPLIGLLLYTKTTQLYVP